MRGGTPLDTLLIVIVGAVLGRGIVEGEHFYGTLAACLVLVALHYLLAGLAYLVPALSAVIEGHPRILIRGGRMDTHQMRAALLKPEDLREAARLRYGSIDLERVMEARQERSGEISLVLRGLDEEPHLHGRRRESGPDSVERATDLGGRGDEISG
ncbi:YetF domain-containing protein [Brevundimonas aurantiaca]|uniref:YetF domain-containing protein n=1 Tax=Brevundimonas aurantiaca TaxID=74316 RepID=UPI001748BA69|nr:YetF domain-containing protein [Brevundimonas aurantiaca]